jgi:hypothetical protein
MERPDDDLLDRWLRAEEEGGDFEDIEIAGFDSAADARAEAALTALFAALPLASAPAPGFADRVLLAVMPAMPAIPSMPARSARGVSFLAGFLASPWARAGVALGLASAALGLPALFAALAPLLALLRPALLAPVLARALVSGSAWIGSGVRLGQWCNGFARTLLTPFESPAVAAGMGACLLISAVALRLLHELVQRERNWTYVDPI